jgi:iron complex outermembrane receptor protein
MDNQKITGGFWFERAHHRQTQPATTVDNSGGVTDPFIASNQLTYNDGTLYQGRNWLTISTGSSLFIQDVVDLMDGRLQITPAFSYRRIKRDFSNYANSGTGGAANYEIADTYSKPLPSLALSFQATDRVQVFGSISRNFRSPSNFEFGNLGRGTLTIANGVGTYSLPLGNLQVKPEVTTNIDFGSRYRGDMFRVSATGFYNKFTDRIASSYNFADQSVTDTNVGGSVTKGVEIEAGTVPFYGWSAYVSGTYTRSTINDNLIKNVVNGVATYYNTAGSQFPDTPKGMAALSVQWANGPYLVNVAGKYTSSRFLTLTNDQAIKGFTTVDLNAAYKLPDFGSTGFKNPIIRLNVSNIFNKQYFLANSGSGSNITADSTGNPVVYAGAPRFASVTFQVDY